MKQQTLAAIRIREMILKGRLAPGQRVAEASVAAHLGISRTPVRQALPALAQEGLLEAAGSRGYVVRGFTLQEILDAIDLRAALEGIAARTIAERGASRTLVRQLRLCLEDGDAMLDKQHLIEADEVLYGDMNARFHALIVQDSGNRIIEEALARINAVPFAAPQALAFDSAKLDRIYHMIYYAHRQHHGIVQALEQGQGARVEALLREHANPVKESLNLLGERVRTTERPAGG
jgi:GntR family transcriptional regulator of vanillate catabolism